MFQCILNSCATIHAVTPLLRISDKFGGFADCMYVLYVCLVAFHVYSVIFEADMASELVGATRNGWAAMSLLMVVDIGGTGNGLPTIVSTRDWFLIEHHDLRTAYEISTVREPDAASGWPPEVSGELRITSRLRVVCRWTADGDAEHMS
jgi:hypothetical protein